MGQLLTSICWCFQEEVRLKARKAKEDLEKFLLQHEEMTSTLRFRKAEKLYEDCEEWMAVGDRDRKEIFEDVQHEVTKREKVNIPLSELLYIMLHFERWVVL